MKNFGLAKFVAIGVTICFLLTLVTSCERNSELHMDHILNVPKFVSEKDEWWNLTRISLVPENLSFDINSPDVLVNSNLMSVANNKAYMSFVGYEFIDDDYRMIREVACYNVSSDDEGRLIGLIDLNEIVSPEDGFVDDICGFFDENGKTKMFFSIQYSDIRGHKLYVCDVDMVNSVFDELKEISMEDDTGSSYASINKIVYAKETVFMLGFKNGESSIYTLEDGIAKKIKNSKLNYIYDMCSDEEGNVWVEAVDETGNKTYISLDTGNLTMNRTSGYVCKYEIYGHWLLAAKIGGDVTNTVLDFNNTYLSHADYDSSEVVSTGDNRVILVNENELLILDRANTNPNVGKQILEAAHLEPLTRIEALGISEFNKNSSEYFVVDNGEYNYWNIFDWDQALSDYSAERDRVRIEMINKLMADISSGDGPDVILGAADYREIQNSAYLVNISERINGLNLNPDEYFTGIINSTYIDENTYLLPYDVYLQGMLINSKDSDSQDSGIRIEDYENFVSEVCNGKDPLFVCEDKLNYFNFLVGASFDLYHSNDGTLDFDNDEFRMLAQYVNDNVPDEIIYKDGLIRYVTLGSIESDYSLYGEHIVDKELLGVPSPDGRGVSCLIDSSGSITVCSSCQDGSWEFISSMFESAILENAYGMPVSKTAFEKRAVSPVDGTPLSQGVIDKYESFAGSCSFYYSYDFTVSRIIKEEMPSYFSGQKSLEEVIKVINSRVGILVAMRV